jgi:hypothetical protein
VRLDADLQTALSPVIHKKAIDGEQGDVIVIQPDFVDGPVKSRRN